MASSLTEGSLLELLKMVTERPRLCVRSLAVRAWVKGSHESRIGHAEAVWYGTPGWAPREGGLVRFEDGTSWEPRFGTMHVFDGNAREVTLVTDHRALYVVRAVLGTR